MSKKIILILVALIIIGALGFWFCNYKNTTEVGDNNTQEGIAFDPKNTTYTIDGNLITLINGKSETQVASGSATKIVTTAWNDPVLGDIDGDGTDDAVMIITYQPGGSGTFYYVVSVIKDFQIDQSMGTNAVLLGDRIAPQNVSINQGVILVNYADRKIGESFGTQPSVGISKWIVFKNGELVEMHICSAQEKITNACTMDYNPVCGDNLNTYSNGCTACSSNEANSWIQGECK